MPVSSSTCKSHIPVERIEKCNKVIQKQIGNTTETNKCVLPNNTIEINGQHIALRPFKSGGFGDTYLANINNHEVIVKKFSNEDVESSRKEVKIVKYLSNIVMDGISPHFLASYADFKCPLPSRISNKNAKNYNIIVMEKASDTLFNLLSTNKHLKPAVLKNIITQIFLSIYTFHQYTRCYHNDIHTANILYTKSNDNNKFFLYKYRNIFDNFQTTYTLPSNDYNMILWDYGLSEPMLNNGIYKQYYHTNIINIIHDYVMILNYVRLLYPHNDYLKRLYKHVDIFCNNYNNLKKNINNEHNATENDVDKLLAYDCQMLNHLMSSDLLSLKIFDVHDKISLINNKPYDLSNTKHQKMSNIKLSDRAKQFNEFRKNNPMMMNAMIQQPMMIQQHMMKQPMMMQQSMMMQQPMMIFAGKKKPKQSKKSQTKKRSNIK
jgi:hypothetical protein